MSKYRAVKTEIDGIVFDSKGEARRYAELKLLEKAGQIAGLEVQPLFPCIVNGKRVCVYRADFVYFENNTRVVEDFKGFRTPTYRLKKKLAEACHPGLQIREVSP